MSCLTQQSGVAFWLRLEETALLPWCVRADTSKGVMLMRQLE